MYKQFFECLKQIKELSNDFDEHWSYLKLSGGDSDKIKSAADNLQSSLENLECKNSVTYRLNGNKLLIDELISDVQKSDKWEIHINKQFFYNEPSEENVHVNFFFSMEKFAEWSSKSDPFSQDHPFNIYKAIKIIVNDLPSSFGGKHLLVCSDDENNQAFDKTVYHLPTHEQIVDLLHIISKTNYQINIENHLITFGKMNSYSKGLIRNSVKVLLSSLVNEIHNGNTIVIRGVRRLELSFCGKGEEDIRNDFNNKLIQIVQWVYSDKEKRDLRLQLLLERISLDINLKVPFITGIQAVIDDSYQQAKERYSFIIYERKDLYQKELSDLLNDLKNLSELYSKKVRSLLSSLLRDTLAAFLLIGITLFSKSTEITALFESNLLVYIFRAFSIYFIISAVFQFVVDFYDIFRTDKEFDYWRNVSKEYMSEQDFKKHKLEVLDKRANGTKYIYLSILLVYFFIAFACWYFPIIWTNLIK